MKQETLLMEHGLRPNEKRAKTAIAIIWVVFAIELVSMTCDFFQYSLLQRATLGEVVTEEEVKLNDLCQRSIGICYLICYIISAVLFIMWFRRAYYNLHLKVSRLLYPEGWAAGSWFVPVISWFRPYQIMREMYDEISILLINGTGLPSRKTFALIKWWWALWLINNLLGQVVWRTSLHAETLEELTNVTIVSIISSLIGIPLVFVTVPLIRNYSGLEVQLAEQENRKHETIGEAGQNVEDVSFTIQKTPKEGESGADY